MECLGEVKILHFVVRMLAKEPVCGGNILFILSKFFIVDDLKVHKKYSAV